MATLYRPAQSGSHWYTRDGQTAHEQPAKTGGTRATTVRDARILGLLPSVTNILNVVSKPQLENWKLTQVAISALRNPIQANEPEEYWLKRVVEQSKDITEQAADLGSRIHNALDLAQQRLAYNPELAPYVAPTLELLAREHITIQHREFVVTNLKHGYAGRCDAAFQQAGKYLGILDFKTRKTEPGKAIQPYDGGHAAQLAAYAVGWYGARRLRHLRLYNVFISTTEPGRVALYAHEQPRQHFDYFEHCAAIWRHQKSYDPRHATPPDSAAPDTPANP